MDDGRRGIVHSELPEQENGLMHGFQLWVNLPARDKLTAPAYQDLPRGGDSRVPGRQRRDDQGDRRRQRRSATGAIQRDATAPLYLDIEIPAGTTHLAAIPVGHNALDMFIRGKWKWVNAAIRSWLSNWRY